MEVDLEKETLAARLRGSLQEFTAFFTKVITQRDYIYTFPVSQESHQITICRALTDLTRMKVTDQNLLINVAPGTGKTWHVCMWIAWCYAIYPDCNFIYVSYSHTLATKATSLIKTIMTSQAYTYLFDVHLAKDSRAKDRFATVQGGEIGAYGSGGSITGMNAGLPGLDRFSGAVIIDDPIKPDDAHSVTIREKVRANYVETISQRPRGLNVPIVFIGQRVREGDLADYLLEGNDTKPWRSIILPSEDIHGNALHPERYPPEVLRIMREKQPYMYASQHLQNPNPPGGALYKPEWIVQMDEYPNIQKTFITADTAETEKSYNDATVFSFWGVYDIENFGNKTGLCGLHWIDCIELRIEPKDLRDAFLDFWQECCRFKIPPNLAAIEKKSTGVTLLSTLKDIRGIVIRDIERNSNSGSKATRFIECQDPLASKKVSINENARHKAMCLDHISKITANDTHRYDDIADTMADAIKIALIENQITIDLGQSAEDEKMKRLRAGMLKQINLRR